MVCQIFLGPFSKAWEKSLKMHFSVSIGGPELIQQGKINMIMLVFF